MGICCTCMHVGAYSQIQSLNLHKQIYTKQGSGKKNSTLLFLGQPKRNLAYVKFDISSQITY